MAFNKRYPGQRTSNYDRYQAAKAAFEAHVDVDINCPTCRKAVTDITAPACPIAVELHRKAREAARANGIS